MRLELDKGESSGYPRIAPTWLQVIPAATAPSPIILAALDLGEAAVIQLAGLRVYMDESEAGAPPRPRPLRGLIPNLQLAAHQRPVPNRIVIVSLILSWAHCISNSSHNIV